MNPSVRRRPLHISVTVKRTASGWDLTPQVDGLPPGEVPRFVVTVDGEPEPLLSTEPILRFTEDPHASAQIRVWAADAAGNVSKKPAIVQLDLDSRDAATPF